MHYTVIIIGGGPIGLACAIEAKRTGIDYIILEKGCLVNSLYNYPSNMTFFSTSERLEIGEVPFVSTHAKPTRAEALEYYRRVCTSFQLNVHLFEKVESIKRLQSPVDLNSQGIPGFAVTTGNNNFTASFMR